MSPRPAARRAQEPDDIEETEAGETGLDEQEDTGDERPVRRRRRGRSRAPRTGARRTLMQPIRDIPRYLRLLRGLMMDRRVNRIDKALVGAAVAYVLLPLDLVPDWLPFLGQVDDVFLVVTALQRLISNAGRRVVMDHWDGNPRELSTESLNAIVGAATFFLPGRKLSRLRQIVRRARR